MTSREKVLTRLDSTGIRREDEAAVPVNGVTVPLPYMVIRTIEKDTWDDLGRVCVKTIMWTIAYPFPPLVEMHKLLVKLRFMETMARVTVVVMADRVAEKPGWAAAVQAVKVV